MKKLLLLILPLFVLVACNKSTKSLFKNVQGSYIGTAQTSYDIKPYNNAKMVVSAGEMDDDDSMDDKTEEFPLVMYLVVGDETLIINAETESNTKFEVEEFTHKGNKVSGSGTFSDGEINMKLKSDGKQYLSYKGKKTK